MAWQRDGGATCEGCGEFLGKREEGLDPAPMLKDESVVSRVIFSQRCWVFGNSQNRGQAETEKK
jgi:hypothetical protein